MTQHTNPQTTEAGDALYDSIMMHINDDLTTSNIDKLDEKYKGETPQAHEERMKRYDRDLTQCDHVLEKMDAANAAVARRVRDEKREMLKKQERSESSALETKIDSIHG